MSERYVQTVKNLFKKCESSKGDPWLMLLEYRNTPLAAGIGSPAQILFNRRLRTKLPMCSQLLEPNPVIIKPKVFLQNKQKIYKKYYDRNIRNLRDLQVGEKVRVYNYVSREWEEGEVLEKLNRPRSYLVKFRNGSRLERNRRFIRPRLELDCDNENFGVYRPNENENNENVNVNNNENVEQNDNQLGQKVDYRTRYGRKIVRPKYLDNYV